MPELVLFCLDGNGDITIREQTLKVRIAPLLISDFKHFRQRGKSGR